MHCCIHVYREIDSDGEEQPVDEGSKEYDGYRMWYSLEVDVKPPVPERSMTVVCACQVGRSSNTFSVIITLDQLIIIMMIILTAPSPVP